MIDIRESLSVLIEDDLPPKEKCLSFLKKAIFLGYLRKGQHIVERDVVDLLKVSRSPVREAIRQLVGEKLVAHYPNKGCIVIGLSARDIKELNELRTTLECFLAEHLGGGAKEAGLKELKQDLQEAHGRRASSTIKFHKRLLELSEHTWLQRVLGQLEEYINQFHALSYRREGREDEAYNEHIAILEALLAQDVPKAQELIKAHIAASQQSLLLAAPLL